MSAASSSVQTRNRDFKGIKDLKGQLSKEDTQMASKLMERHSASSVTREAQTEATARLGFTPGRAAVVRNTDQGLRLWTSCSPHAAAGHVLSSAGSGPEVLPALTVEFARHPAVPPLGIALRTRDAPPEHPRGSAHGSVLCKSRTVQAPQRPSADHAGR